MSNHIQSVRLFPCANQPYLLEYGPNSVELEGILIQVKALTASELKLQATWQIKGNFGSFKTISDSFQDPCLNTHKSNILDAVWLISWQNKHQPLNFKFLNLSCPSKPIVAIYEQIWCIFKNTQHGR